MQKVTLICVGKLKETFYVAAVAEYQKRLARHCKLDIIELSEHTWNKEPSQSEIEQALLQEAESIEEKIPKGSKVIALCVEGKEMSSESLSQMFISDASQGVSQLTFLVGGSFGMHERIKKLADVRLSVSPMTFPHHLFRVMLLEQIYRAYQIASGTHYHK